jgi:hypothetical protein
MDDEMSNQTETTLQPSTAPVHPVSPPVVAGPPGLGLDETRTDLKPEVDPLVAEHWAAGEWPTSQLPLWADLTARHGTPTEQEPDFGAAGMHTWEPEPGERSMWIVPIVAAIIAGIFLGLLGLAVQRMNWLPASVPLIGKDSGVAACEAIAEGQPPVQAKGVMNMDQYKQAREVFADSRYESIRINGTQLMDLAWQAQNMGDNNLGVLALMGGVADAYSGLAGGCASVGYTIPSIGAVPN